MFMLYIRVVAIVAIFSSGLILPVNESLAEDVGDQYYPIVGDKVSVENMEQMHQQKMQILENEYKKKMAVLETRYNKNTFDAEAHAKEIMEFRKQAAALKEERLKRREELEIAFMKNRQELHDTEFTKNRQYVANLKDGR